MDAVDHNSFGATVTADKTITCKAAVAWGPGEPLVIQDVRVAAPQKMEVRIKILFTSICHTDLGAWKGENEAQRAYPRILGHEAAGIVESVGEGVEDIRKGDRVIPIFQGECGNCSCCKNQKTNLCLKFGVNPLKSVMLNDGKTRFSTKDGSPIFHFLNTSTFSEYTVVDSACVVKIDSDAPLEKMSLLSCGVSTGVGAAWNVADVQPGSSVAIFGLGAVGLAVAEGARVRGASKIIGVDINPTKFAKGRAVGITDFINPEDLEVPVHEKIGGMTEGGVDYSFECAGNLQVLREAFLSTHMGWGLTVLLGIHPSPMLLPLHPMEMFNGRQIIGSVFGGFKGKTQLPRFAQQCMCGTLNLDEFITHELPFDQINKAFQLLVDGKSLRCLLQL
ncbi:Alcohol dehydrogenase 2 [Hibiscus syriacus]|uniref:alcohol dehydrogenase n=1 Tax=Hibiscus syriacus TaxID=106335 RepID=A0A6A3BYB0_HIBSY|nr:alcohol dehydrogenase-like 4 [Hibiscus syriacus]KAE8721673.1 Alcohol dehydrogenase 2 [Hibiscus syriacus]